MRAVPLLPVGEPSFNHGHVYCGVGLYYFHWLKQAVKLFPQATPLWELISGDGRNGVIFTRQSNNVHMLWQGF
jgi:hypothetical protein